MKNGILISCVLLIIAACNKSSTPLAPIINPNPYQNKYAGTYIGTFNETNNGVDSTGVFKKDTSYTYILDLSDAGNYTFTINKGPVMVSSIPVDSTGHFAFFDFNRNIGGYFVADSVYVSCKSLNGSYNYPQWFVIQQLAFAGKKQL